MRKLIFAGIVVTFFALALQVEIAGPSNHAGNVHQNAQLAAQ